MGTGPAYPKASASVNGVVIQSYQADLYENLQYSQTNAASADIKSLETGFDANFFYFRISLVGVPDKNGSNKYYLELETDIYNGGDLRPDILVSYEGLSSHMDPANWIAEGESRIKFFIDSKNKVGGNVLDAPDSNFGIYDEEYKRGLNAAYVRLNSSLRTVEIAIRRSALSASATANNYIGGARAWATQNNSLTPELSFHDKHSVSDLESNRFDNTHGAGTGDWLPFGPGEPSSDLSITKVASNATPRVGTQVTFTLTASNAGPSDATGVVVTDQLPSGYAYVNDNGGAATSESGGLVTWTIGALANGSTATLEIVATVLSTGEYSNTATINGDQEDPDSGNNTSTVTPLPQKPGIALVKTAVVGGAGAVGDVITYTFTVENTGNVTLTDVTVADPLSGLSAVIPASAASLAPGDSATFTASYTITAADLDAGSVTNQATATGTPPSGDDVSDLSGSAVDNDDETVTPLAAPVSDLSITKISSSSTPNVGSQVTFTLTASNAGPDDATGVVVTDQLPSGYTYVSDNGGASTSESGGLVTWTIGALSNGSNPTLEIVATVLATGEYANTATIDGDQEDPDTDNNTSTVTVVPVPVSDLSITKTVNNASAAVGGQVVFTITVSNAGPSVSNTTTVTDLLPAGFTYLSNTVSQGIFNNETGVWAIGSMNNAASAVMTVTATVNASGSYLNIATVSTSSTDLNTENNSAQIEVTPDAVADLVITKSVNNSTPLVGENVSFTITVTNLGPSSATAVSVNDALPNGYTYVTSSASIGTYSQVNGVWTIGSLASGSSAALTMTAAINASGNYLNVAVVNSPTEDPNADNNTASASVDPRPVSNLGITKSVNNANPTVGSQVVFTITVTDAGPSSSETTTVNDVLPDGYTLVSSSATQGAYNSSTGVWNIGSMNSGVSVALTVTVTVNAEGDYLYIAVVQTSSNDPNQDNNRAEASVEIETEEIEANDNDMTEDPIQFNVGDEELVNVLSNDLINGQPATIEQVILTVVEPAAHPGVVLDVKTGTVSVSSDVPTGTYTIKYKICVVNKPSVCDIATVMLNIINNTFTLTSTIEGNIWYDFKEDGVWRDRERFELRETKADERALYSWTVYLEGKDRRGNTVSLSTTTDPDGSYTFEKVPEGEFKVYRESRNTWIPAFPLVLNDNPTGQYHIVKVTSNHGSIASEKRRIVAGNSKGWINKLAAGADTLYIGAYLDLDTTLDGRADTRVFVSGPIVMSWSAERDLKVEYTFSDFELLGDSKKLGRVVLAPSAQGGNILKGMLTSTSSDSLVASQLDFPFELRIGNDKWVMPSNQKPSLNGLVSQILPYNQKHVSTNTTPVDLRLSGGDTQARLIHMELMPLYGVDFSNNQSVFGTAPGSKYPVIMEDNGARHILPYAEKFRNEFIGSGFTEIQTIVRNRTNVNLQIEEQQAVVNSGVEFMTEIKASQEVIVSLRANVSGFVHGWIDYNRDGKWTADEKVASGVNVAKGVNQIRFIAADGARSGSTWTRWRLCDCPGDLSSTGAVNGGEVEDLAIVISSIGGSISGVMWYDNNADGILGEDEQRLEGLSVWADLNANGTQDSGEPGTKTGTNGAYVLESVPDGSVIVRPEIKNSWVLTNIAGASYATVLVKEQERTQNVNFGFMSLSTSDHTDTNLPTEFALGQNYPNPFNPNTVIPFDLAQSGMVRIALYDVTGRLIKTLVDQNMGAGRQTVALDASTMPSGVYIVRMDAGGLSFTSKLTLIK